MVLSESPVDQPNSSPRCGPERTMGSGCATESHRQGQDAGVSSCSSRRTMIGNHVHRGKRLPALCATIRRHDSNERTSATTLFPLTPERGLLDPSRRRRVASGGLITAEQARSLIVHSDTFSALVRRMNTPSTRNPRTVRGGSSRSCGTLRPTVAPTSRREHAVDHVDRRGGRVLVSCDDPWVGCGLPLGT